MKVGTTILQFGVCIHRSPFQKPRKSTPWDLTFSPRSLRDQAKSSQTHPPLPFVYVIAAQEAQLAISDSPPSSLRRKQLSMRNSNAPGITTTRTSQDAKVDL